MTTELKICAETIVSRVEDAMAAPLDDDLVLFDVPNGKFYGLDNIATRVWELVEQPVPVRQVCAQLMAEFDVDEQTCESDTLELMETLCDAKLITAVAA